jgi:pilus assembly protein Flp/PilA
MLSVQPMVSQTRPRHDSLRQRHQTANIRVLEGDNMLKAIAKFQARRSEERGATAVEYGLMVALIAIVIIASVTLIGTNLNTLFSSVASKL